MALILSNMNPIPMTIIANTIKAYFNGLPPNRCWVSVLFDKEIDGGAVGVGVTGIGRTTYVSFFVDLEGLGEITSV